MGSEFRDMLGKGASALLGSFMLLDVVREVKHGDKYASIIEKVTGGGSILWEVLVAALALGAYQVFRSKSAPRPPRPPRNPGPHSPA